MLTSGVRFGELNLSRRWFLEADDGGGSGGGEKDGDKGKDGGKGDDDDGGESKEIEDFDAWLAAQPEPVRKAHEKHVGGLKSALDAERKAKKDADKAAKEAATAKAKEAEAALEANKEFEKLATERKTKVDELEAKVAELAPEAESYKARAEAAETAVAEHVDGRLKALKLDASVVELLDGKTPVQKLAWLTKHEAKLAKGDGKLPGSPNGDPGGETMTEEQKRAHLRRGMSAGL